MIPHITKVNFLTLKAGDHVNLEYYPMISGSTYKIYNKNGVYIGAVGEEVKCLHFKEVTMDEDSKSQNEELDYVFTNPKYKETTVTLTIEERMFSGKYEVETPIGKYEVIINKVSE